MNGGTDPDEESSHAVRGFFASLLITMGGLICLLSGGCSLYLLVPALLRGNFLALPFVLVVGGIPFGIGAMMFMAGWDKSNK